MRPGFIASRSGIPSFVRVGGSEYRNSTRGNCGGPLSSKPLRGQPSAKAGNSRKQAEDSTKMGSAAGTKTMNKSSSSLVGINQKSSQRNSVTNRMIPDSGLLPVGSDYNRVPGLNIEIVQKQTERQRLI